MNGQAAYHHWSTTYDIDKNLTRDLDQDATREILRIWGVNQWLSLGVTQAKIHK